MWEWLNQLTHWHWFILGLVLLITEAFGAAGFFLGGAIGALFTGVIVWLVGDINWQLQVLIGAALATGFSLLYWRYFRADEQESERPELNHRTAHFIGRKLTLKDDIDFEGRVQIGDTFWKVRSDENIPAGSAVEVDSVDDTTLHIKRLDK